jgi:N-acetylmuramoyl-L-alanine amidase
MLSLAVILVAAAPLPLVVIDAGHGGAQDGAVGVCGAKEKDVTLAITNGVARLLGASTKVKVQLTRDGDATLDLKERSRIANDAQADLFVSIHANSGPHERSHGVETYLLSRTASDRRVAKLVERENEVVPGRVTNASDTDKLLATMALSASHVESARFADRLFTSLTQERPAHGHGVLQAPFFVLLAAKMPAALVEVGFLTNRTECTELASPTHQAHLAQSIATAILLHVTREELAVAR